MRDRVEESQLYLSFWTALYSALRSISDAPGQESRPASKQQTEAVNCLSHNWSNTKICCYFTQFGPQHIKDVGFCASSFEGSTPVHCKRLLWLCNYSYLNNDLLDGCLLLMPRQFNHYAFNCRELAILPVMWNMGHVVWRRCKWAPPELAS